MMKNIHGIEIDDIKPGSQVTLGPMVVVCVNRDDGTICLRGSFNPEFAQFWSTSDIRAHTPRTVAVGDTGVIWSKKPSNRYVVLGFSDDLAWVKLHGRSEYDTAEWSDLSLSD